MLGCTPASETVEAGCSRDCGTPWKFETTKLVRISTPKKAVTWWQVLCPDCKMLSATAGALTAYCSAALPATSEAWQWADKAFSGKDKWKGNAKTNDKCCSQSEWPVCVMSDGTEKDGHKDYLCLSSFISRHIQHCASLPACEMLSSTTTYMLCKPCATVKTPPAISSSQIWGIKIYLLSSQLHLWDKSHTHNCDIKKRSHLFKFEMWSFTGEERKAESWNLDMVWRCVTWHISLSR